MWSLTGLEELIVTIDLLSWAFSTPKRQEPSCHHSQGFLQM
jgi:hypothetical protein